MLINGIDVADYKAQLLDRTISTTTINSITDWMDEAVDGSLLRQNYDWRNIKLTFLIRELDEDKAYKRISILTEALKQCTLRFDDINLDFPCILDGTTIPNRLQNGVFKVIFNLKNDWGIGEKVSYTYQIESANAKQIHIDFIRNWTPTTESYTCCFDTDEIYENLGSEDFYIDTALVETLAQGNESWSEFFLALGIPINKYKQINDLNGFLNIDEAYSSDNAINIFNERDSFIVYYNRFHKDGYNDFPINKTYPSLVWQAKPNNNYYFNTGIGIGWNIQDITVNIIGRWYDINGKGCMIGAGDNNYSLSKQEESAYFALCKDNPYHQAVFQEESSGSGGNLVIGTLEDISSIPLREYGIKSSKDGNAPVNGFADLIFNGVTLTRVDIPAYSLTKPLTIGFGRSQNTNTSLCGDYLDIARVRIYYQGKLIQDLIPIDRNLKNCFINDYDIGFYDVKNMQYVGWTQQGSDNKGRSPQGLLMNIPGAPDIPTPAPTPTTHTVTVINGTGSGNYEKGALVTIIANPPSDNRHKFGNWVINEGDITLTNDETQSPNSFIMPESDVEIKATYVEDVPQVEPKWLLYTSLDNLQTEDKWTVGAQAASWDTQPKAGREFCIAFSVPGVQNVSFYPQGTSGATLKQVSTGKYDDRYYIILKHNGAVGSSGYSISGTYKNEEYTKEFSIKSLF